MIIKNTGSHIMELLRCEDIRKSYGDKKNKTEVLHGISFSLEKGKMAAIIGASGSGKSTLLNIIGTIDNATEGSVILDGKDITHLSRTEAAILRRRDIGIVYQFFNLIPNMNIQENILLPLRLDKKKPDRELLDMLVNRLGLSEKLKSYPSELSGGQQQRASMLRALLYKPTLLLADEPTGNLDSKNSAEIMELMQSFNRELSQTILYVTHSRELAGKADRVIELSDGCIISDTGKEVKS